MQKFFINQTNGSRDIVKCTSKHKGCRSKHSHSGRGSLSFFCPASMVPARQPRPSLLWKHTVLDHFDVLGKLGTSAEESSVELSGA